jgi:hypothetical protein
MALGADNAAFNVVSTRIVFLVLFVLTIAL